jgi:hypothetical protein
MQHVGARESFFLAETLKYAFLLLRARFDLAARRGGVQHRGTSDREGEAVVVGFGR